MAAVIARSQIFKQRGVVVLACEHSSPAPLMGIMNGSKDASWGSIDIFKASQISVL
tara:strand:- start:1166 stop:1333 length:168 start_codon:yes stop_codon:yes gene_type:complete